MSITPANLIISSDKALLQPDEICRMLRKTYWAKDRPREVIETAMSNSICFGAYIDGKQTGFARCVTDFATFYYLADVVVDESARGLGIGMALVEAATGYPPIKGLMGVLKTRDAAGLYEKFGFRAACGRIMEKPSAPQETGELPE